MVTPAFYYVFNISLSCNNNGPIFIRNLWWLLLLGNHLKSIEHNFPCQPFFVKGVKNALRVWVKKSRFSLQLLHINANNVLLVFVCNQNGLNWRIYMYFYEW